VATETFSSSYSTTNEFKKSSICFCRSTNSYDSDEMTKSQEYDILLIFNTSEIICFTLTRRTEKSGISLMQK